MSVNYFLFKPEMPALQGKYVARTVSEHSIGINEMVERIALTKTSLGAGDIRGVIETMCQLIELEVTSGNSVHLGGICTLRPTVKGTFDNKASGFDPAINYVDVSVAAGSRLRKGVRDNAVADKMAKPAPMPDMSEYYDVSTGHYNTDISVGNIGQFNGDSLTFDATDPEQGLFVVDGVSPSPMPIASIQKATDKQIVFLNQPIAPAATSVYFLLRRRNKAEGPLIEAQSCELTVNA